MYDGHSLKSYVDGEQETSKERIQGMLLLRICTVESLFVGDHVHGIHGSPLPLMSLGAYNKLMNCLTL